MGKQPTEAWDKYRRAVALAETNYRTRLIEAQRQMGEARELYEEDLKRARGLHKEAVGGNPQ